VEVWDRAANVVHKVASLPLADQVPIDGVPTGPRQWHWRPTDPATLVWVEALDEGNPKKKVPHRDRVPMLKTPFQGSPMELVRTEHRFVGLTWGEKGGLAFVNEYDRDRRWERTFLLNADRPADGTRLVWDRSRQDHYHDPGSPIMDRLPNGHSAMHQQGDWIFLSGSGASPEGDRPFLDRFNLKTLDSERLFRCDANSYESVVALLDDNGSRWITRHESPTEPPNYYVRSRADGTSAEKKPLTQFPDPTPQLRGIKKQRITYRRADGVQLSFTLYLPPDYREGTRLPTVVWAYPLEYNDPDTAGQIVGSTQHFTTIRGPSHLFFLLSGYAVLDGATMPVIGDPETVNNTYIEQIVASAKAAIDKAVAIGVTDPERVGVGGHSYGAFMTANLLAHSDLFRAGIARSGAYNRTLTPFGFQTERRTLWEAPDLYVKMSPFMSADKVKTPILLIHGEADNNPGTFPIQSERFYQAVRGNGGTVRYVTLPHESHGYAAIESIEHTLYEMISWFDKHVKNAPSRATAASRGTPQK
jgi:dipeptidyl aminopeptidase/acylaminoacyl peptidase